MGIAERDTGKMRNNSFIWQAVLCVVDIICAPLALYLCINAHFLGICVLYGFVFAFLVWRAVHHGLRAWELR
jgi:hypothetical protein